MVKTTPSEVTEQPSTILAKSEIQCADNLAFLKEEKEATNGDLPTTRIYLGSSPHKSHPSPETSLKISEPDSFRPIDAPPPIPDKPPRLYLDEDSLMELVTLPRLEIQQSATTPEYSKIEKPKPPVYFGGGDFKERRTPSPDYDIIGPPAPPRKPPSLPPRQPLVFFNEDYEPLPLAGLQSRAESSQSADRRRRQAPRRPEPRRRQAGRVRSFPRSRRMPIEGAIGDIQPQLGGSWDARKFKNRQRKVQFVEN